jgi:ribosome-associated translation inhibitor RaiA
VTVSVPHRGRVHVEGRAITARLALDGALTRLERRLARTAAVARDSRRRPKKYYAAARALAD